MKTNSEISRKRKKNENIGDVDESKKTKSNEHSTKVTMETDSNTSVQPQKRKNNETIVGVDESKKTKSNEHSTKDESPSTSNDRSNNKENEKNPQNSSGEKPMASTNYMFSCYYCDDPNICNDNLNEIFNHCTTYHSLNNSASPFLFQIVDRNSRSIESFTLSNSELIDLLSIEKPSKEVQSNSTNVKAENLLCGKCEKKLAEIEYFKHIEMHAKQSQIQTKIQLTSIHSNTKVIFSNGLVLTKYNLSTTHLGDNKKFDVFVNALLSIKTEEKDVATSSSSSFEVDPPVVSSKLISRCLQREAWREEFENQMKHMSTIKISGIFRRGELNDMFLKICQHLQFPIKLETDIFGIHRAEREIIVVKFNDIIKKRQFLKRAFIRERFSTRDIFEDVPSHQSAKIKFKDYMTKYYANIEKHLANASQKGKINSYKLTENGFTFNTKRYRDAIGITSIKEFEEIISDLNEMKLPSNIKMEDKDESKDGPGPRSFERLKEQMRKMNEISIFGMPQRGESKIDIFIKICKQLQVRINFETDIIEIYQATPKVIVVKFTDFEKKKEFLNCKRINMLYTHDIFEDVAKDQLTKITFDTNMTPYFARFRNNLVKAQEQGIIHSFELTAYGFTFKKMENSNDKFMLTIDDVKKIIHDKKKT